MLHHARANADWMVLLPQLLLLALEEYILVPNKAVAESK